MPISPQFLTVTGADDQTDRARMVSLSARYPVEWGILVSGRHGRARYPSVASIEQFCGLVLRRSLHLCGPRSYEIFQRKAWEPERYKAFDRVQVNARGYDLGLMQDFAATIGKPVIIQIRGAFPEPRIGLHYLFDQSGGRGVTTDVWPAPCAGGVAPHGFAGGLGPDNILEVLGRVPMGPYWLDMESAVRTDDVFDLNKVEAVCRAVYGDGMRMRAC